MASEIILDINGYSCNVLKFNYEFYRKIDSKGRPVMGLQGGDIYVELESKEESTILEFMLSERNPLIRGRIKLSDDSSSSMIRELIFDEAYIFSYGERMNAEGNAPMAIWFAISATRLDVNRIIQLDRRIATTHGLWWQEYKEEEQIVKPVSGNAPPSPLVTSVQGNTTALPRQKMKYSVAGYSLNQVNENDRKRVKWMVQVDGKKEVQKIQGEVLELLIEDKWAGKEITVMPFLKEATEEVCIKTAVQKKIVALFIGGAADKNDFYGMGSTTLIEDQAKKDFDKDIKVIKTIACTTMYLGFDEVYRDEHVEGLSKTIMNKRTPVYIVGHSLGGWNGAHLSQILTDKGYNIEMLITLDPVGEGGIVWAFTDIHYESPKPKSKYWINISAVPNKRTGGDIIADIGERWIPENGPNINFISKKNHEDVYGMFNEPISQNKSAFQLLIEHIKK